MIEVGQEVNHFQRGSGVIVSMLNVEVIHVKFSDGVTRMMCGENLTDVATGRQLHSREAELNLRLSKSKDLVEETLRKAQAILLSRRQQIREGLAASCTYEEFVAYLLSSGNYKLSLTGTEEGIQIAQDEWISWAQESFPEHLINLSTNRSQPRQWKFSFSDVPGTAYPFPVIMMGSQEKQFARLQTGCRGLYQNGTIHMHYACELEKLVRLGLRAK